MTLQQQEYFESLKRAREMTEAEKGLLEQRMKERQDLMQEERRLELLMTDIEREKQART